MCAEGPPLSLVLSEIATDTTVAPLAPVVVHVTVPPYSAELIRIWQSTFLLDRDSTHTSRLIGFERVALYPHWTIIDYTQPHIFKLVFEGMPKQVRSFDLAEIIPEPNGFRIEAIARRPSDIYEVELVD